MNATEAKEILKLFRRGTADADDPQIAEARALAQRDPELARWLEQHGARQLGLREKFRQIPVPDGLKEQILSEQAAQAKIISPRRTARFAAAAVTFVAVALLAFWLRPKPSDDTLAIYQNRMAGVALRGYNMDLLTNDAASVRAYLAQQHAPADFILPAPLQKADVAGCAVQHWQGAKVAMICFRTGQPLAPGAQSDLWLFVVDRAAVKDAPGGNRPQFAKVNQFTTAMWIQGGKFYLLGAAGDEAMLRKFL